MLGAADRRTSLGTPVAKDGHPLLGFALVGGSALLFGVVAAMVKSSTLPNLVLLEVGSWVELLLGAVAIAVYHAAAPAAGDRAAGGPAVPQDLYSLALGPRELRGWVALRGFLYFLFVVLWWGALSLVPVGDATAIVLTSPIFSALFGALLLGESVDWSFGPIYLVNFVGLLLIVQPSAVFKSSRLTVQRTPDEERQYFRGAAAALSAAAVAALINVCTRKSKRCFWTAVNTGSSALSALVFTPLAILVWLRAWPGAEREAADGWAALVAGAGDNAPQWRLALTLTTLGFAGMMLQTLGYQREQAGRASLIYMIEIPLSYILQYIVFSERVTPVGLLGVLLSFAAGGANVWRRIELSSKAERDALLPTN